MPQHIISGYVGAVLTGFLFGWNLSVLNVPADFIKCWIQLQSDFTSENSSSSINRSFCDNAPKNQEYFDDSSTTFIFAVISSIYCIGGMFGALFGGRVSDRFGRKISIIGIGVVYLFSSGLMILSFYINSWVCLMFGRIFVGLAAGASTAVSTVYLTEIAPESQESFFGVSFNLGVVTGSTIAQFFGIDYILGDNNHWVFLFVVQSIWSALVIGFTLFGVDSKVKQSQNKNDTSSSASSAASNLWTKFKSIFSEDNRNILKTLLIGIHLMMSQQFCGINAFFFYSAGILQDAGFSTDEAAICSVVLSSFLILGTLIGIFLIKKYGRRQLMIVPMMILGLTGIIFSVLTLFSERTGAVELLYFSIFVICVYELSFACGPGAIPWMFIPEAVTLDYVDLLQSICCLVNWLCSFTIGLVFPPLNQAIGSYVFLIFGGYCLVSAGIIWYVMPETKDRRPAQVQDEMKRR